MKVQLWSIDKITPYPQNPRVNDQAVEAVAKSIEAYGFRQPLVVDKDGVIVVGHTRWKAAKRLGMAKVPVHVATELSEAQIKAYRLADNKTAELAEWDKELLPLELRDLQALDFDLGLIGFSDDELSSIFGETVQDGLTDPDAVPEPPDEPVTKPGDIWVLGDHRLMCGDSSKPEDVDRLLDGAPIHLVNTDPPYNVRVEPRSNNAIAAGLSSFKGAKHHQKFDVERHPGKAKGTHKKMRAKDRPLANDFVSDEEFDRLLTAWFGNMARVLEPGRGFYIWGGYANVANYPPVLKASGLYFSQSIIWHKQHPVLTRKDFMGDHEWCQPPDTQILTPSGTASIASLRSGDRVVSYNRDGVTGLRGGLGICATSRPYEGSLFGVVVGRRTSWCTAEHLWSVRLAGSREPLKVRARDLRPEVMAVPVPAGGQRVRWETVRAVDVQPFSGRVYSMAVDRDQHYVADGLVTHNCFYGWREGAAHQFLGPNNVPDVWSVKKVNPQSMIHLCLHPDALVLSDAGFRPIQTVQVGDRVFSGDGTFHCVEHVSSHPYTSEHLYRIVAKGGNTAVEASDNHPFLIWRPAKRGRSIIGGTVGWMRADEVRHGDYTMTPVLSESGTDPFPEMDEEDWFLFGLYLAQGHLQRAGHGNRRYPAFSLHKRRQDLAERIWKKWPEAREYDHNDYRPEPSSGTVVMAFDGDAGERFEALGGRLAHGKRMSPECLALPRSKRAAILHGWLNGDGCVVHDRDYWQGNTVSADLAANLCLLAESVGYRANVYGYDPPEDLGGIGGRKFKSRRHVYYLYFYKLGRVKKRGCPLRLEHDGREYSLRQVKRVEQVKYSGDVWNLSVEGHPSFQTAVGLSHNTEKPVELAVRAMQYSSRPGENVLDLFGGSGSTLIAAQQTGRKAFLMELDQAYCDVIRQRFEEFSGQIAIPATI